MTTSVIIITYNRPSCVRRCLECLFSQTRMPNQIIVVDASSDNLTCDLVRHFPGVLYLQNKKDHFQTAQRNLGLKSAAGDIIAFLDDDAFARPDWLENLVATYTEPLIGGVGGRALNNQPNEAVVGVNEIGRLKSNGDITGFFAADPGKVIEVDHIMGCNMSFRSHVIATLGGFREGYPGISGMREESDISLCAKRLGYKILFNPKACVEHIGAPQVAGRRFDVRYAYYAQRNHLVLLIRNYGLGAGIVWRYLAYGIYQVIFEFLRKLIAAFARFGVAVIGMVVGMLAGIKLFLKEGCNPVRHDPEAEEIRKVLQTRSSGNK